MRSVHKLKWIAALVFSLPLVSGMALGQPMPDRQDSAKVSSLLVEAKKDALQLQDDSHKMRTFPHQKVSWQSHANQMAKIQQDVKDMRTVVKELSQERAQASSWQQLAIDTICPQLIELALNVEKSISFLKKSRNLQSEQDRRHIESSLDSNSNPVSVISDFIEYDNTKKQLEELTRKLAQLAEKLGITPGYGLE